MNLTVAVGDELPGRTLALSREHAVRYAGASGDFNPIHWSPEAAAALGLDGVIIHGMWTMGAALAMVTEWAGGAQSIRSYFVRFTRPIVLPPYPQTIDVVFSGRVTAVEQGLATVSIDAVCGGDKVLGAARAEVFV